MFEKLVADTLTFYLGEYVQGLDEKNLTIAIWGGDVILEKLELKKEALNSFGLPIYLKSGEIGKLKLKVPWINLKNEPIIVEIEKLFLIAAPKNFVEWWNEEEVDKREQQSKQQKLKWYEMMKSNKQSETQYSYIPLGALFTKIVDNIQFSIKDVHFRFEDDSVPEKPFSAGITLEHLIIRSVDENWNPAFISTQHSEIRKLVTLKNLAIYWNSSSSPLTFSSEEEFFQVLEKLIYKENSPVPNLEYILNPVCGSLKLLIQKVVSDKSLPKYTLNFEFSDISLFLNEIQFRGIVDLIEKLNFLLRGLKYQKFRPQTSPKQDPKSWWHFARDCILSDLREKKFKKTAEFFRQRRIQREEYIQEYKKLRRRKGFNEVNFNELERKLSFSDIILYRSLAENELKTEGGGWLDYRGGWLDYLWGSSESYLKQKEEFYDVIEFNENQLENQVSTATINLSIEKGSGTLSTKVAKSEIICASFSKFQISIFFKSDSLEFKADISTIQIYDKFTKATVFPYLISPIGENNGEKFFSLFLQMKKARTFLKVKLSPSEIIYVKSPFSQIAKFFKGKEGTTFLNKLEMAILYYLEAFRSETTSVLSNLQNNMELEVDINIRAPRIVVPESITNENSLVLVTDLGNLSVKTNKIQNRSKEILKARVEDLYDIYQCDLTQVEIFMAPNKERFFSNETMQIIEKFSFNVEFHNCIQIGLLIPQFKISASLPSLKINFSLNKCLNLVKISKVLFSGNKKELEIQSPRSQYASRISNDLSNESIVKKSKFLECKLKISQVVLELNNDVGNTIIKVNILKSGFQYTQRTYSLNIYLFLHTFYIEDCLQKWGTEFQYLANSIVTTDSNQSNISEKPIIQAYLSTEDHTLALYFNRLHLVSNRETIFVLTEFINTILSEFNSLFSDDSSSGNKLNLSSESQSIPKSTLKLKIISNLDSFLLSLNDEGKIFSQLSISNSTLLVEINKESVQINGTLGNVSILDFTPGLQKQNSRLLEIKGDHIVQFFFQTFSHNQTDYPGYDYFLRLKMNSIEVKYFHRFLMHLQNYFNEIRGMKILISTTASKAAEVAKDATMKRKVLLFQIEIENPKLIIPESSSSSKSLIIDFGRISIFNQFSRETQTLVETITLFVKDLNVQSLIRRELTPIINKTNLILQIRRIFLADLSMSLQINGEISRINIFLTGRQYLLFLDISTKNFREYTKRSEIQESDQIDSVPPSSLSQSSSSPNIKSSIQLQLNLPQISLDLIKGEGKVQNGQRDTIVSVSLNQFELILVKLFDSSIKADFKLHSLEITDSRPNEANKFKQLLMLGTTNQIDPLKLHFETIPNQKSKLLLYIFNPRINLVVPAFLAVNDFLIANKDPTARQENTKRSSSNNSSNLKISVNILNLELCLGVDTTKFRTKGFVLSSNLLVNTSSKTAFSGSKVSIFAKDLQLYRCTLRKLSSESKIPILEPMDLCAKIFFTENKQIQISADSMHITFSKRDFDIAKQIVQLNFNQTQNLVKKESSSSQIKSNSMQLVIDSGGLQFTLIDDGKETIIPLAEIYLLDLYTKFFSGNGEANNIFNLTATLRGDYYNPLMATWEPFVESWTSELEILSSASEFELTLKSYEKLNVNFSHTGIGALWETMHLWQEKSLEPSQSLNHNLFIHPLIIRNETGEKLRYWLSDNESNKLELEDQAESGIITKTNYTRGDFLPTQSTLAIQILPWSPLLNLPINQIGTFLLPLTPKSKETLDLIYEISFREGSKILLFRSNKIIVNNTNHSLQVSFENEEQPFKKPIEPGKSKSLPINSYFSALLRFRPSNQYQWGKKQETNKITHNFNFIKCQSIYPTDSFNYIAKVSQITDFGQDIITLSPPLIIENLLLCNLEYKIFGNVLGRAQGTVAQGMSTHIHEVDINNSEAGILLKIFIPNYEWSNSVPIKPSKEWQTLKFVDQNNHILNLQVNMDYGVEGAIHICIYCRYWLINRTGHSLFYRSALNIDSSSENWDFLSKSPEYSNDRKKSAIELAQPIMFSYNAFHLFESKTEVKISGSKWSKGISLESPGVTGFLEIEDCPVPGKPYVRLYEIGYSIGIGQGNYYRTKTITFSPRFILVNNVGMNIECKQKDVNASSASFILQHNEHLPWHWVSIEHPKEICIKLENSEWSSSFPIDHLGDFAVKIPLTNYIDLPYYLAPIQILLEGSTFFITINAENRIFPPYRIENLTQEILTISQQGVSNDQTISPFQALPFTWDQPSDSQILVVKIENSNFTEEYSLDIIKTHDLLPITIQKNGQLTTFQMRAEVFADGPTRVLRLTDTQLFETTETISFKLDKFGVNKSLIIGLPGIGLSFVDETPQELMYITFEKVIFEYTLSRSFETWECSIQKIQVDNQLPDGLIPIVLCPHSVGATPFFHISIVKSTQYESIDFFLYFSLAFQEVDLNLEELFINSLLTFLKKTSKIISPEIQTKNQENKIMKPANEKKIYFETFQIFPLLLNFRFVAAEKQMDSVVRSVISAIGVTFGNINGARLSFNALELKHLFSTWSELGNRISKYYFYQMIAKFYQLLGSFEIFGSPRMFFSGVKEILSSTTVTSPRDFGGIAKGVGNVFIGSISTLSNILEKVTSSVGKGLATLSMDQNYVRERERKRKEVPSAVSQSLMLGVSDLFFGIKEGITGIIKHPMRRHEGGLGIFKGVYQGLLGIVIKPTVGVLDFVSRTSQLFNRSDSAISQWRRFRPPRYIGPDRIIQNYSYEKSYGQEIFWKIKNATTQNEWYLHHFILGDHVLLITNKHIMLIAKNDIKKVWSFSIKRVTKIEQIGDTINFHLKMTNNLQNIFRRTITITDPHLMEQVYLFLQRRTQSENLKLIY